MKSSMKSFEWWRKHYTQRFPNGELVEEDLRQAWEAATAVEREACAETAIKALPYKHLASENGEVYAAQDHALSLAAKAIRARGSNEKS